MATNDYDYDYDYDYDDISVSVSSYTSDNLDSLSDISIVIPDKTYFELLWELIKIIIGYVLK
jgi:hypothetical protein